MKIMKSYDLFVAIHIEICNAAFFFFYNINAIYTQNLLFFWGRTLLIFISTSASHMSNCVPFVYLLGKFFSKPCKY